MRLRFAPRRDRGHDRGVDPVELAQHGIRVVAIARGFINRPILGNPDLQEQLKGER